MATPDVYPLGPGFGLRHGEQRVVGDVLGRLQARGVALAERHQRLPGEGQQLAPGRRVADACALLERGIDGPRRLLSVGPCHRLRSRSGPHSNLQRPPRVGGPGVQREERNPGRRGRVARLRPPLRGTRSRSRRSQACGSSGDGTSLGHPRHSSRGHPGAPATQGARVASAREDRWDSGAGGSRSRSSDRYRLFSTYNGPASLPPSDMSEVQPAPGLGSLACKREWSGLIEKTLRPPFSPCLAAMCGRTGPPSEVQFAQSCLG